MSEVDELKQRIADLEWELMLHQTGWARAPKEAMFRATDASGFRCWYSKEPKPHDGKWWFKSGSFHEQCDTITPPTDFRTTLEPRPVREAKS